MPPDCIDPWTCECGCESLSLSGTNHTNLVIILWIRHLSSGNTCCHVDGQLETKIVGAITGDVEAENRR